MDPYDALIHGLASRAPELARRPVREDDFARSYVTYSELFGVKPNWEIFFERLRYLGLQTVMASLSFMNSFLYVKRPIHAQAAMIRETFDADLLNRLARLPDFHTRVVYSPAQTLLVMRSALLHSPDRPDEGPALAFSRALIEILLMANDLLDADVREKVEGQTPGSGDPDVIGRALLSFSIRSTVINGADAYDTSLARASIIFGELAARADVRARAAGDAIDIAARFEQLTGLSLRDYFAIGWMLMQWFVLGVRDSTDTNYRALLPQTFFGQTRLNPLVAGRILDDLMQDYATAKARCAMRQGGVRLFAYDIVPFLDRPLYQIRSNLAVPINLPFLAARLSIGVYWKLFDSMTSGDRRRWSAFYGHIVEAYARDAIRHAMPPHTDGAQRVFPEFTYHIGKKEYRTTDVVGINGGQALFFEVTATRLRMEDTLLVDDPIAVEADLERIVIGKARQLDLRIRHFREGQYAFGETKSADVNMISPVVVTGEALPIWTTTLRAIRSALAKENLLQQPSVEPLRVIGIDEIEMLEALTHAGVDSTDVLRSHANDAELRNVSLRNFIALQYEVPRNERLSAEYLAIGDRSAMVLFGTHLGPARRGEVARRAYEIFEERGRLHGHDVDDWLQAEHELRGM